MNAAGEWGSPTVVSVGGLDALNPAVTRDRAGVVHAAWYERNVGRYQVHYAFLDDGEWQVPSTISPDTSDALGVAIDVGPDGTVHLVWEQFEEAGPEVRYSFLTDAQWSPSVVLAPAPAVDPVIATDDSGRLFAAWSDRQRVYAAELQDGLWVETVDLGPGTNPALAAGDPVHIAWTRPTETGYEVVVAALTSSLVGDGVSVLQALLWFGAAALLTALGAVGVLARRRVGR